jgi:hypothetical protein
MMAETYKPDILVKFGDEDIDDIGNFDYCYCWAMEGLQECGDEDDIKKAEKIEEHYEKVKHNLTHDTLRELLDMTSMRRCNWEVLSEHYIKEEK